MLCRHISIIADEYVDREFGTGALKITPGHDPNDYEIGQRHGLDVINIMNNNGSLNANAGQYCNLDRAEARAKLWADMEVGMCAWLTFTLLYAWDAAFDVPFLVYLVLESAFVLVAKAESSYGQVWRCVTCLACRFLLCMQRLAQTLLGTSDM